MRPAEIRRESAFVPIDPRRSDQRTLASLVGSLLRAVDDPSAWPVVLDQLTGAVGGARAHLWTSTGDFDSMTTVASDSRLSEYADDYNAYYGRVNPTREVSDLLRGGTALSFSRLVPEFQRTEYWAGLHRLHRIDDELGMNGHFDLTRRFSATLSVQNELGRGAFSDDAHHLMAALGPHFAVATRISLRLRGGFVEAGPEAAIEQLAAAALVVDRRGSVRGMNAPARSLARRGVLGIEDGVVRVGPRSRCGAVLQLISEALRTAAGEGLSVGGTVRVMAPEGALEVFVAPLRSTRRDSGEEEPLAMLVVTGAADAEGVEALTAAQYAVAERLARGATVAETAVDLGVSTETVKSHVKEVYRKLGIASRAELARRIR